MKLRVGYISPDFHAHSVAYFVESLLKAHNRTQFELFGYYNNVIEDSTNIRLKSYFDHWNNISGIPDVQIANKIFEDEIDILVDLAGHSANNSLAVLIQKPAPVQVTWLGYPNTSGLSAVDYRITDSIADPVGKADTFHSETLVRLPNGFLCYQGNTDLPISTHLPFDKNGYFTFGSFNNFVKVTPQVISVWSKVLSSVPNSKLILKSSQFADSLSKQHCLTIFKNHDISPSRIKLLSSFPSSYDHMTYYDEIDLALDPFPYNGTTTTFEALWMGVPTLTLLGNVHAARVGASILSRIQLDSYIAKSEADYIQLAIGKSQSLDELRILRRSLRSVMKNSPLCKEKDFASEMESAYQQMWNSYCKDTTIKAEKNNPNEIDQILCH